jgi:WhiB family redox-sensing transcriptional regulator
MDGYRAKLRSAVTIVDKLADVIDEGDTSWIRKAKCKGMGNETFFPARGDTKFLSEAKAVCNACEVSDDCLSYAIRTEQTAGIWGGKSGRERSQMLYMMRKQAV